MNTKKNHQHLLAQFAVTMAEHPRYTIKELAESAGISKASLHRIYGTRENLTELLVAETQQCIESIIAIAGTPYADYETGLEALIKIHFEHKEFLFFAGATQLCQNEHMERYLLVMDAFFLNGKEQGFFKMEFDAAAITELFIATFSGMIDAERRGRIASAHLIKLFKSSFLNGTASH